MARTDTLNNFLTDVANSIREKKGTTEPILASEFDTEIESIESGGGGGGIEPSGTIDILNNGTYDVTNYANAEVNVPTSGEEYFTSMLVGGSASQSGILKSIKVIPSLQVTGSSIAYACAYCTNLESIGEIDTKNVTHAGYTFVGCNNLKNIPLLDASKMFAIQNIFSTCSKLENFGGLLNLGKAYSTSDEANRSAYSLVLSNSSLLTHESLMNVINNLYDIAGKGCNTQKLTIGATNLAKLTDEEIAIATNKGWTVS